MKANARGGASAGGSGADAELRLLPVIQKESAHPCFDCARCCTYVAIEIDAPTTNKEYDFVVWYLYHPGVSVFVDWEGSWFVKFDSRCRHLTQHGLCGVYEDRPAICRDFDWRDCEMHVKDEPPDKHLFERAEDFLGWLERQRPKAWKRFEAWRRERKRGKTDPALRRLRFGGPAASLPR